MNKAEIRKAIKQKISTLEPESLREKSRLIREALFSTHLWQMVDLVCLYSSIPGEVETDAIITRGREEGKRIGLPKTWKNFLSFYDCTPEDTTFVTGKFGIREPHPGTPELGVDPLSTMLIILPGLAFDPRMNRLGRGGGYYDRYLDDLMKQEYSFMTIGLCFEEQLHPRLPVNSRDYPVDMVITDKKIITPPPGRSKD